MPTRQRQLPLQQMNKWKKEKKKKKKLKIPFALVKEGEHHLGTICCLH